MRSNTLVSPKPSFDRHRQINRIEWAFATKRNCPGNFGCMRRYSNESSRQRPAGAIRLWRVKSAFWGVFRETPARELAG